MSKYNQQLPEETPGPSRPGKVVLTLLVTLLAAVAFNFLLGAFLRRYTTNLGYYLIAKKWDLLEAQEGPVDWLLIGDSSCNQGVRPDIILRDRGETALNLCSTAQQLVVEGAWQLQHYIDLYGPPRKGVIVVHVYDVWPTNGGGNGGQGRRPPIHHGMSMVPLPWRFWKSYEPVLRLKPEQEREMAIQRYVPGYAQSRTVRKWLLKPMSSVRALRRRRIDDTGYMRVDEVKEGKAARDTRGHIHFMRRGTFSVSKLNRLGFQAIADIAGRHGVPVTLALSPLDEGLVNNKYFPSYMRRVRIKLEGLCASADHVDCVLLDRPAAFPTAQMENSDHVTHPLAEQYTQRLMGAATGEEP